MNKNKSDMIIEKTENQKINKNKSNMIIEKTENQKINNIKEKVIEINNNLVKMNSNININNKVEKINSYIDNINSKEEATIPIVKNIHVNKDKLFDKIGILDPEGLKNNPLTEEPYKNIWVDTPDGKTYSEYGKYWVELPMYSQKEIVIEALYNNQCILITAGTGSGKTVLVPKYLLHVLNYQGKIAITIPRTAATIGAATYAAMLLDVQIGEQVGYLTKDKKKINNRTNIVYATDGYLLALIKNDPLLNEYDAIIIDEAHERNTNIDLLFFYIKKILKNRPTFKFIIMSATIDPKLFLNYYKEFNMKHIEGSSGSYFDINEIFLPDGKEVNRLAPNGEILGGRPAPYIVKAVDIIYNDIIKANKQGDILALFPGKADCNEACRMLGDLINKEKKSNPEFSNKPFCIELKSSSKSKTFKNGSEENYAIGKISYKNSDEGFTRRVVMATEVAESSLTFSGDPIDWVIDTGLSKGPRYYPDTELEALEMRYIAVANHTQRKGRTGRKRIGTCYNVFTKAEYKSFLKYPIAPIMENNVIDIILNFLTYPNITHINLPFQYEKIVSNKDEKETLNTFLAGLIEQPHLDYVNNAIKKLFLLGALNINDKKAFLTPFGLAITFFRDISIEKAACIIHSYNYKCSNQVIDLMALLHELDDDFGKIINEPKMKKDAPGYNEKMEEFKRKLKKIASSYGDHITLHNIMETYKEKTYDIKWESGRQELISKSTGEMGEGTIWAKDNFINSKSLQNAFKLSKDLNKSLGNVIGTYKRNNPDKSEDRFIFRDTAPFVHDKIDDNIMHVITLGYLSNIVKKTGNRYSTCFPEVSILGEIDRSSLFNYIAVKPTNCIFSKSISINGRPKLQTFSKIPIKVIDNLNNDEQKIIKECGKLEIKNFNKKQKKGQSQKGQFQKGQFQKGQFQKGQFQKGKSQKGQFQKGKSQKGQFQKGQFQKGKSQKVIGGDVNDFSGESNILDMNPESFI
jgi:HrpA-like RNA helicase